MHVSDLPRMKAMVLQESMGRVLSTRETIMQSLNSTTAACSKKNRAWTLICLKSGKSEVTFVRKRNVQTETQCAYSFLRPTLYTNSICKLLMLIMKNIFCSDHKIGFLCIWRSISFHFFLTLFFFSFLRHTLTLSKPLVLNEDQTKSCIAVQNIYTLDESGHTNRDCSLPIH